MTSHGGSVTNINQRRPYQGYPYVNPLVNDVPSTERSTSNWTNLPRRPQGTNPRNPQAEDEKARTEDEKARTKDDIPPVVYIDIPSNNSNQTTEENEREEQTNDNDDPPPTIYIDLPYSSNQTIERLSRSDASTPQEGTSRSIDETIYFDQFEGRRIGSKDNSAASSSEQSPRPARTAPEPPRPVNLALSKESFVYGRLPTPDDGFSLTPIPINEFPEPPPAYSEVQHRRPAETQQSTATAAATVDTGADVSNPPRTVVITNGAASGIELKRKLVVCHHCGSRVHTMVVKQAGRATDVLAILFFMFCLPLAILVYMCKCCMYDNHYCPSCSKLIGYESPIPCQGMVFATE